MPVVSKIITNSEGCRPVLVDFQNGKINSGEEDSLETALYKDKHQKTIVAVTNSNMLYTGVIENEKDLYNNFILVHDKRDDMVDLIQVDCCTVSPLLNKKNDVLNVSKQTSENLVSELNKQFGSKKTKRNTEQRERLTMNIDTIKEQLENTVADVKVNETDIDYTASAENDSLYRPKINRDASTIGQVYNLEYLVPRHVLATLSKEGLNIANGGDINDYGVNSYVSTNISHILESSVKQVAVEKIEIFIYINYLMKFMNTPVKNLTKKIVVCDKSMEVNNHILDNFSIHTGNRRTRPLSMKDKALCYILVLSAIALDYKVDIEPLSKDFKTGIKKVLDTARMLAFTVSTKNKNIVTLKLPLPAPLSTSPKRKRR